MDRSTIYAGELPRTEDVLRLQQRTSTALGSTIQAAFGTSTTVDGFTLLPTAPASMTLNLGPGSVYQYGSVEASPWSILPADSRATMKQGILLDTTPLTFVAPATAGYAQNYLVQVQYQDLDDTPVVLQFFNSINPAQPLYGPGGSGTASNTRRAGIAAVQAKAGIAASSGTQAVPTPDAGWVGLFVVTVAYGQTSITSGNVAVYQFAPFIAAKLPQIPAATQNQAWTYFVDQGTANNVAIVPQPAAVSFPDGQSWHVRMATANTGASTISINGTVFPVVKGGTQTVCAGGEWGAGDLVRFTKVGSNMQIQSAGGSANLTVMTSNTTFTVPSTQYPTIQSAVLAAGQIFISPNVTLTIAVTAGYIEYLTAATGPIYLSHPHGQRIKIIGASLNGAFPTQADVGTSTNAQTLSLLQSRFRVQVQAVGTNAWELHSGAWGQIANILTTSDGTNSGGKYGALLTNWSGEVGTGSIALLNCWFHNCGLDGLRAEMLGGIQVNNVGSTYCTRAGFWISHKSIMECNTGNILSMFNQFGVSVQNDGGVFIDSASGTMDIRNNTSHGIYCVAFGEFNALPATSMNIIGNGGWGVYCYAQSLANLPSQSVLTGNTSGALLASLVSIITAVGASVPSMSPSTSGTVGNNGSYIYK